MWIKTINVQGEPIKKIAEMPAFYVKFAKYNGYYYAYQPSGAIGYKFFSQAKRAVLAAYKAELKKELDWVKKEERNANKTGK